MSRVRRRAGNATTGTVVAFGLLAGLAAGYGFAAPRDATPAPAALDERVASALREVDPVAKRRALRVAVEAMTTETAATAFAGFEREAAFADACEAERFFTAWAALDVEAATEAAVSLESPLLRSQASAALAYEHGLEGRLDEGRALLERLSLGRVRDPTRAAFAEGIVRSGDHESAATLLDGRSSARRNRVIESYIRSYLLNADAAGLMAWVDAIPEDAPHGLKRSAFALAARWLSSVDPTRAAAWYDAQPEGAPHTRLAHVSIAEEWIERDPDAALAWAFPRIPPEDQVVDVRRLITRFAKTDATAALAWMERQEPLGMAAAGIAPLVKAIENARPSEALSWAQRIEDEKDRDSAVERVLRVWLERDPDAARAWMAQHTLPESIVRALEVESAAPGMQPHGERDTSS